MVELQAGLADTLPPLPEPSDAKGRGKGKGKGKDEGKAKQAALASEELVQNRSKAQLEAEIKELGELKQDLALKVLYILFFFFFTCSHLLPLLMTCL